MILQASYSAYDAARMAVCTTILGSGSRGNCAVVSSSRTNLLVDAGFSCREIMKRLQVAGYNNTQFDAIIISHEHSDHVAGLRVLAKKLCVPVFINRLTLAALGEVGSKLQRVERFCPGESFSIGDIEVTPFTVPHDAADPVAFTFVAEGVKVALVTDLGYVSDNIKHQLKGAACLVLESNHDLDMLKVGPYPWSLKQRVMSRVGHLSNDSASGFLKSDFDGSAAHIVLAHLSENNNIPQIARMCAEDALQSRGFAPQLSIACQNAPLPPIVF